MAKLSVEAQHKLLHLKQEYIASFPEKVNQLQVCWQKLESKKFAVNEINALATILHKIAGSAGSHEIHDIHSAARSAEQICKSAELMDVEMCRFKTDLKSSYERLIELLQEPA